MKAEAIALIAVSALGLAQIACAGSPAEQAAVTAATKWLALVDNRQYDKSYDAAASFFQSHVTNEQWVQQIQTARSGFGKMIQRKLKSEKYATSLPGAPDGEYVVIQFNTQFEKKKQALETITPMKQKDGTWRVSGYFIR
ncbi:MAG TPA: DUF4019 domain-containing protein [Candidatus Obscuribacterales bacterium]